MAQLNLFDDPDASTLSDTTRADRAVPAVAPGLDADALTLARQLPPLVRLGTMSWAFSGWTGLVYAKTRTTSALAREGLAEYARHPLFGTVEFDRTFYAPVAEDEWRRYAAQLPPGYACCIKAPQSVTAAALYDPRTGDSRPNPAFLSVDRLVEELLAPLTAAFGGHTGPLILEFPRVARAHRLAPHEFLARLDEFLGGLPHGFDYAVEVRDRALVGRPYAEVLARRGAAHVFNYWSDMPRLDAQARIVDPASLPFVVIRLLLAPGTRYDERRGAFAPFDRLQAPDPAMREEVTALVGAAVQRGRPVWVLANNKAEGSAPLTIRELARRIVADLAR